MFTQPAPYVEEVAAPLFTVAQPPVFTAPAAVLAAPVFDHPPTGEQADILDAAATGQPLVIEAGAGTGKTSTLKMVAAAQPGRRALYLAYNKAIATDAASTFPANVQCSTAHSLAFRQVGHQYKGRLDGPRLPARDVARLLRIPAVLDLGAHALTSVKVARLVMDTVARYCHSDWETPAPTHVPVVPGLEAADVHAELCRHVVPLAHQAWADLTAPNGRLKFTHDHYLKLWALTNPTLPADLVFLDEAQDANPVISRIVDAQNAQKVLVGDENQAIYGWRGAVDAMASFSGNRLFLTQSFRFGADIAAEANVWLELLDAPLRLTGNPAKDSKVGVVYPGRAILCRTNAGAIGQATAALASGLRPALVGGGDDIRRLARACQDLRSGRGTEHPELMAFASWAEVKEYAEHDAGGADLKTLVKLVDGHGPEAILLVVDQLVDESNADLIISTAHRAKGREWETVRLAADWSEPYNPDGTLNRGEAMLTYVAVTRAQDWLDRRALGGSQQEPHHEHCVCVGCGGDITDTPAPAVDTLIPDPPPVSTDLPADMVGWLNHAKNAATNAAEWKKIADHATQKLKDWCVEHGVDEPTVNGQPAFSYKENAPGGQLNGKSLKADHPDIYAKYYEPKKASRPFNFLGAWK